MEITGLVEVVSIKEESGTFGVKLKDKPAGKEWFNGFTSDHTCPKKGQEIKINYKKSGRWNNIQTLDVVEEYPDKAKVESEPVEEKAEELKKPAEKTEKVTKEDIKKSLERAEGYLNSAKTFLNVTKDYLEKLE